MATTRGDATPGEAAMAGGPGARAQGADGAVPLLLVTHESMIEHDPGVGHPERPDRLRAVLARLRDQPVPGAVFGEPRLATAEEIRRVHSADHLEAVEAARGRVTAFDADTRTSKESVDCAFTSAGGALRAVEAVVGGEARRAFALGRPPGHHAEAARAMGFCLFNNVAVAAAHARAVLGMKRVMIVDWDVHHGNGTQHIFEDRDDVLFFSVHRWPYYPGTGAATEVGRGAGEGFTINAPLPAALGDGDYAAVFRDVLAPAAEAFRPDLLLVSAGFDPHRADPLGDMRVTEDGFAALCGVVQDLAEAHAGGRLALLLEGGYDLEGLARSVHGCCQVLVGATPPDPGLPSDRGHRALAPILEAQRAVAGRRTLSRFGG